MLPDFSETLGFCSGKENYSERDIIKYENGLNDHFYM